MRSKFLFKLYFDIFSSRYQREETIFCRQIMLNLGSFVLPSSLGSIFSEIKCIFKKHENDYNPCIFIFSCLGRNQSTPQRRYPLKLEGGRNDQPPGSFPGIDRNLKRETIQRCLRKLEA